MTNTNKIDDNEFASLKDALKNTKTTSYGNEMVLRTPPNKDRKVINTWVLRFIPNRKLSKTFFYFKYHGWNSTTTGKYVSDSICPSTFGQENPIDLFLRKEYSVLKKKKILDKEHPARKALRPLLPKESWLANVYVVSDPVNPENNGKTMILKFGAQIKKIIDKAMDSEDHGKAIFDMSSEGQNFRLRSEYNGEGDDAYPTYASSDFRQKNEGIVGIGDDVNKINEVIDGAHDVSTIYSVKTNEELERILKEHYLEGIQQVDSETLKATNSNKVPDAPWDDSDSINMEPAKTVVAAAKASAPKFTPKGKVQQTLDTDQDVEDYLKTVGG